MNNNNAKSAGDVKAGQGNSGAKKPAKYVYNVDTGEFVGVKY